MTSVFAETDWVAPQSAAFCFDPRAMELALRIASLVAAPIGAVDEDRCHMQPLNHDQIAAMARVPAFSAPLNRAVARQAGLDQISFSPSLFERFANSAKTRLCALIATSSRDLLRQAATSLVVAVLHQRIVMMPLKEQRVRLLEAFGEEAFLMATREAPLQYRALAELADYADPDLPSGSQDAELLRERALAFGLRVTFAFVEVCEPELLAFLRLRSPSLVDARSESVPLSTAHCALVTRFFSRRFRQWSDIIG